MSLIEFLEWDSNHFETKVGRLSVDANLSEASHEAIKDGYSLIYCYARPEDVAAQKDLKSQGAQLLDQRVVYAQPVQEDWVNLEIDNHISSGRGREASARLCELAISCGHQSRFALDEKIPTPLFEKMYHIWIENSLNGSLAEEVHLYTDSNVHALCTLRNFDHYLDIGLIGVHSSCRGKGIGRKLVMGAMKYAAEQKFSELHVATQVGNQGACAFYEALGFKVAERVDIYHLWLT